MVAQLAKDKGISEPDTPMIIPIMPPTDDRVSASIRSVSRSVARALGEKECRNRSDKDDNNCPGNGYSLHLHLLPIAFSRFACATL